MSHHVVSYETTFPFTNSFKSHPSSPSPTNTNPWLSNLLFFQACSHSSILGPHPFTQLPSILGPLPTVLSPLAQTQNIVPIVSSYLSEPPISQPVTSVPSTHTTLPEPNTQPTLPEPNTPTQPYPSLILNPLYPSPIPQHTYPSPLSIPQTLIPSFSPLCGLLFLLHLNL